MIKEIIFFLVIAIHLPIWFFVSHGFIHLILQVFFKRTSAKSNISDSNNEFDYALILTAHQNTEFIPPLVDSIIKQKYNNYTVYIVADDCDIRSIKHLESQKVKILKPVKPLNSKIKSIDFALENQQANHDYMIIFDPDNLLDPDYLYELNNYLNIEPYNVVQTRLAPKNTHNIIAKLDTLGSAYYDFIFRESKNAVGLSAHIYGLGVVIPIHLYKEISYNYLLGGFDKRIQLDIISSGHRIGYCKKSIVYDEKTSNEKTLQSQRTRWIFSYFKYMKAGIQTLIQGFKKMNIDIIYFGLETLKPPIVILLLTYLLLGIIDIIFFQNIFTLWLVFLIIFFVTPVIILMMSKDYRKHIPSLIYIPKFLFIQLTSLLGLKKAKKSFLKTSHEHIIFIDDIVKSK